MKTKTETKIKVLKFQSDIEYLNVFVGLYPESEKTPGIQQEIAYIQREINALNWVLGKFEYDDQE